jgi:predicted O-linked N-acetylglucosamine transferase (SPINDLY family)
VLDPFPHTGGTTTCESLWMGVPVVTLVGQSFYERLSYSNLNNAGLGDLCAFNFAQYKDNAVRLALDIERRRFLRQNLRAQIKQNPLGQPQLFAKDFGNTIKITLGMDRIAA